MKRSVRSGKEIKAILSHLGYHSRLYLIAYILLLFIIGLWPFNFTEKNNAVISPTGGLEIARHGTAYTALPAGKLQDLKQFAILIDLTTSSDGLNAFEKIFSYFVNQEEMNFLLGQWKDGLTLHLRTDKHIKGIKIGSEEALIKEKRTQCLITYDGAKLILYQDGKVKRYRDAGPLNFSNWDRTYPLVVGTDAGGRSQWKGNLYQIAVWERSLSPEAVADYTRQAYEGGRGADSRQSTVDSKKKKSQQQTADDRPLIHYVFNQENTYQTEIRGKKALGVRDLGKGGPADLVIQEHFAPYERVYFGWDSDWMKRSSDWLDVAVNILGFVPFGLLMMLSFISRQQRSLQPTAGSRQPTDQGRAASRSIVVVVVLAVVAGFVVSMAIELLQAYLPSRDSSLRDLVTNTLGTAMGAVAAAYLLKRARGSGQWPVVSGQ